MTTPRTEDQKPTPHPGVSVAIIAAVLTLTVFITFMLNKVPPPNTAATPAKSASVCHPNDKVTKEINFMKKAPPVDEWAFDTTPVAYPKSKKFGPGFIEHKGEPAAPAYSMCFPRSPEGALFAATYAAAESLQKQPNTDWAEEFVSKIAVFGSEAIDVLTKEDLLVSQGYNLEEVKRVEIVGYRYDEFGRSSALIHIGTRVTDNKGKVTYLTSFYNLVWEDKDWKLQPRDPSNPTKIKRVPNLDGYISWR